jgi:hypothetical protein
VIPQTTTWSSLIASLNYITADFKMFSRLNQFISKLGDEPKEQGSGIGGAYGFQILRNKNNDFPLEPWFDFIIGLNGRAIVRGCYQAGRKTPLIFNLGQPRPKSLRHRNPQLRWHQREPGYLVCQRPTHSRSLRRHPT